MLLILITSVETFATMFTFLLETLLAFATMFTFLLETLLAFFKSGFFLVINVIYSWYNSNSYTFLLSWLVAITTCVIIIYNLFNNNIEYFFKIKIHNLNFNITTINKIYFFIKNKYLLFYYSMLFLYKRFKESPRLYLGILVTYIIIMASTRFMLFNALDLHCNNYYHTVLIVVLTWFWFIYVLDKLIQTYYMFMFNMQMQLARYEKVFLKDKNWPTICKYKKIEVNSISKIDWGLNTPFMQKSITVFNLFILIVLVGFFFWVKPYVLILISLSIILQFIFAFFVCICCYSGLHCGSILNILSKQGLAINKFMYLFLNTSEKKHISQLQSTGKLLTSLSAGEFLTDLYNNPDNYPSDLVEKTLTAEGAKANNVITVTKHSMCDFPQNQISDRYDKWVFRKDSFLLHQYPNYRWSGSAMYQRIPKQVPPTDLLRIPKTSFIFKDLIAECNESDLSVVVEQRMCLTLHNLTSNRRLPYDFNFSGSLDSQRAEATELLKGMRKHLQETFIYKLRMGNSGKLEVLRDSEYYSALVKYLSLRSFYQENLL